MVRNFVSGKKKRNPLNPLLAVTPRQASSCCDLVLFALQIHIALENFCAFVSEFLPILVCVSKLIIDVLELIKMAPTLRKRTAAPVSIKEVKKTKKGPVKEKATKSSVPKANGTATEAPKKAAKGKKATEPAKEEVEETKENTANGSASSDEESWKNAKSVHDFKAKLITGEEISLEKYKGHVLLIVNVASNCGYTKRNYEQLVELDEKYRDSKGLRILAFPCNQFGKQEPGDNEKVRGKIEKRGVKFDVFEKIDVNSASAHPLYKFLKSGQNGLNTDPIKWNFNKFIVDKEGKPVARFLSPKNPLDLVSELEKYW